MLGRFDELTDIDTALTHQFFIAEQQRLADGQCFHTLTGNGIE